MRFRRILSILLMAVAPAVAVFRGPAALAGDPNVNTVIVRALIQSTKHKDPDVRAAAAHALGDLGDKSAVPVLIALLDDPSSFVSDAAGEALGKIGDHSAVSALVQRLDPVPAALSSNPPGVVVGDNQTALPEWAGRERAQLEVTAVRALGALHDPTAVAPIVREGLDSNSLDVRIASAVALGKIGDAAAAPALIAVLQDYYHAAPTNDDQATVIQSVVTPQPLVRFDQRHAYLRTAVVRALGEIGDPSAVPVLKRAFYSDENSIVRDEAADALQRISRLQQNLAPFGPDSAPASP